MKFLALVLGVSTLSATALAGKDCEELKGEIDARIKAKGVSSFSLNVVENESAAEGKVVGTCGGGTKKIVYVRGESNVTVTAAKTPEQKADDVNKE